MVHNKNGFSIILRQKGGNKMIKKIAFMALVIFCAAAFLAGCNTMKGLGKDIKTLGEKLEGAADKE